MIEQMEEARAALVRSRIAGYVDGSDEATRELNITAGCLDRLRELLQDRRPSEQERLQLRSMMDGFRVELRLAEAMHQQAEAWWRSRARSIEEAAGLNGTGYGADGAPAAAALRLKAWEG